MAAKEKTRNILKFLLNDIAEIFPLLFVFYAAAFLLSLVFESWKLYFNWPIFHVNILILGLFSFLSEYGRKKFATIVSFIKVEAKKIVASTLNKSMFRDKKVNILNLLFIISEIAITYIFAIIKRAVIGLLKLIIKIIALALDIRQQGFKNYLKFVLLAIILTFAITKGANVVELLIWIYAFRAIFVGIDSRISAGIALALLATCPILLILKKNAIAEQSAVFAYYFLVIVVITQIIELRRESKTKK
ncbi:MAG: hypothetical protein V1902_02970 [Candidatus Falkowbacteria bacterium]